MFDASAALGNLGLGGLGPAPVPQSTVPITDQSPQVDGGRQSVSGTNTVAPAQATKVMHYMAAIVLVSLALLWLSGGLAFRGARLP